MQIHRWRRRLDANNQNTRAYLDAGEAGELVGRGDEGVGLDVDEREQQVPPAPRPDDREEAVAGAPARHPRRVHEEHQHVVRQILTCGAFELFFVGILELTIFKRTSLAMRRRILLSASIWKL